MLAEFVTFLTNILGDACFEYCLEYRLSWGSSRFFSVPRSECQENALKYNTTACFHILSNRSFISLPIVHYYAVRVADVYGKKQLSYAWNINTQKITC